MLIGITHTPTGQAIIREPRVLKVGIGISKGRAIQIYMNHGKWIIRHGIWENKKLIMKEVFQGDRAGAEAFHAARKQDTVVADRPQKISYFTFSKRSIIQEAGKAIEVFEPDFAAIEAHGDCPRELDIVLMGDNPYNGEYQMWSATELKCHGDGVGAMRVLSMGNEATPHWAEAKAAGEKMFHVEQCWTNGCQYAVEGGGCKPGVTLNFQLANSMRLGATAYFHTTSIRSSWQIFSSLETIRTMAARAGAGLVGLPLKMVLTPFRSNHNGQAATQYGVSLELRAEDMKTLRARLTEAAWVPQQLAAPTIQVVEELTDTAAPGMVGEFYESGDEVEEPVSTPSAGAAAATNGKTEALAEKLAAKRESAPAVPATAPVNESGSATQKTDLF